MIPRIWGKHRISIYICNYINNTENPLPLLSNIQDDRDRTTQFQGLAFTRPAACLPVRWLGHCVFPVRWLGHCIFPCTRACLNWFMYVSALIRLILTKWTNGLKYLQRNQNLQINLSRREKRAKLTSVLFLVGTVSHIKMWVFEIGCFGRVPLLQSSASHLIYQQNKHFS